MNISEPFIKRPVATSLLMVGVLLVGLLGYYLLPISALPPVDFPTIQITAQYPGASPDVMASSVTTPLERQFGQISGLATMTSVSSFANAAITLQFTLDRNIDAASQDVQAAINAARGVLPAGMPNPPTYSKVNPAATPILTLQLTSDTLPLEKVNDLADTVLAQKLSEVSGVGLVTIEGNQKPAVRVRVNPAAIASLGLSLEDVRTALIQSSVTAPKGRFDGARQAYAINANDQIFSAADYRNVIIAYRNGSPVRVADLGDAVDNVENVRMGSWVYGKNADAATAEERGVQAASTSDLATNSTIIGAQDLQALKRAEARAPISTGQPAVLLDIQRQPGANIIQTADSVKVLLPKLRASLPSSVKLSILGDRTETIRASVSAVQFTLLLTIALVVMVIFVFVRKFWATVIPSIALPLTLVATFGVMQLLGFSLDNLSLMALTISTGFVVDDAIVMIDAIVRYIEAGETPMEAALKGAKQIGFTIVSLSVSLIAVFIPLLFMTGIVGRLFHEFAITLSVAVAISALISLTLTPMMCARLLRAEREEKHGRFFRVALLVGCAVGPNYRRPTALPANPMPAAFGDTAITNAGDWKTAEPSAHLPRGNWWELYDDPELNRLEGLAATNNQQIAVALANFDQAHAAVQVARADFFPQISSPSSAPRQRTSVNASPTSAASGQRITYNSFQVVADASWELDLWGRIRRQVEGARATFTASADDLESAKLSVQAEVAIDYFTLRALDAQSDVLAQTVAAYQRALELTQNRHKAGIASDLDVAQAETQLKSTQAQIPAVDLQRAQLRSRGDHLRAGPKHGGRHQPAGNARRRSE